MLASLKEVAQVHPIPAVHWGLHHGPGSSYECYPVCSSLCVHAVTRWGPSAYICPSYQNTFLLVCLGNSYLFLNTQLRHLFLCAACLPDSFPQGAGLSTDSLQTPLTSNIHLLHTVLTSSDCAWDKQGLRATLFCSGLCVCVSTTLWFMNTLITESVFS